MFWLIDAINTTLFVFCFACLFVAVYTLIIFLWYQDRFIGFITFDKWTSVHQDKTYIIPQLFFMFVLYVLDTINTYSLSTTK